MVFCGKPSRACYNCRVRRIKCDFVKPGCSQCSRADKLCPGYRDPRAIVIRDESQNVARKARTRLEWEKGEGIKAETAAQSSLSLTNKRLSTGSSSRWEMPITYPGPYSSLPVSVDDQGFCFIISQYVVAHSKLPSGHPDYTSSRTWNQASLSGIMRDALTSVGLAALSNVNNNEDIMVHARMKLACVLRHTIAALQDPLQARSDQMLRMIMMLWLFEMITYDGESTKSSSDHLTGAASLVRIRGSLNFVDKSGLRKILRISFSTFVRYIQTDELHPNPIIEWTQLCEAFRSELEFPGCALAHTLFKLISLRASIKRGEINDPGDIMQRILSIEEDLARWKNELPSYWAFENIETSVGDSRPTFERNIHVYHDIWISRIWSHYRWMRILIQETILQQLEMSPPRPVITIYRSQQRLESVAILRQMATDICVSVPFHLCNYNPQSAMSLPRPEITGAFDLLWPLTVIAESEYISEEMYIWVVELLKGIGHRMGIKQATSLVNAMKVRRESRQTKHIPVVQ